MSYTIFSIILPPLPYHLLPPRHFSDPSNFSDPKPTFKSPKRESDELPPLPDAIKSPSSIVHDGKPTAIYSQIPASELSRKRRAKFSDRLNILQSLMPWNEKMTIAKLLEEAQKYIKFLEAQVTELQSMPILSFEGFGGGGEEGGGFGYDVGMLTRQQMLEVCCNSDVFQGFMCQNGYCLFAEEQVLDLKRKMMEVDEDGLGLYLINDVAASASSSSVASVINY